MDHILTVGTIYIYLVLNDYCFATIVKYTKNYICFECFVIMIIRVLYSCEKKLNQIKNNKKFKYYTIYLLWVYWNSVNTTNHNANSFVFIAKFLRDSNE